MRTMKLKVMLPHHVLVDDEASKIVAEAENGSFGLLPRHADFATALTTGLLAYDRAEDGRTVYLAVDEGVLVKQGGEVLVSTRHAVAGADLGRLRELARREFRTLSQQERKARSAIARLEFSLARRFIEFHKNA